MGRVQGDSEEGGGLRGLDSSACAGDSATGRGPLEGKERNRTAPSISPPVTHQVGKGLGVGLPEALELLQVVVVVAAVLPHGLSVRWGLDRLQARQDLGRQEGRKGGRERHQRWQ